MKFRYSKGEGELSWVGTELTIVTIGCQRFWQMVAVQFEVCLHRLGGFIG